MHFLVLTSSPNIDGLTAACTSAALQGIRQTGSSADEVRLNDLQNWHVRSLRQRLGHLPDRAPLPGGG